ncbi:MAG: hypothetical protein PHU85_15140 [Phycisphaerae bacterium]|nr:hypothetical protein [Phycisphaerae bacterium]
MPWTAEDMKKKGATEPVKAAAIANAILRDCQSRGGSNCERLAIATALARTNGDKK